MSRPWALRSILPILLAALCAAQQASGNGPASPPSVASSPPNPSKTPNAPFPDAPSQFKRLDITPGTVSIINLCSYTVYLDSTPATGCPSPITSHEIAAGGKYDEKILQCGAGNNAFKAYKKKDGDKRPRQDGGTNPPMQFEYGKQGGLLWYDISFIDCVQGDAVNNPDLSWCASWDGGMQMAASGDCVRFWCMPHEPNCCDRTYCDSKGQRARDLHGVEPTGGCNTFDGKTDFDGLGLTIQLCGIGS